MNKRLSTIVIGGSFAALVAVTLCVYFLLDAPNTTVSVLALVFTLLSELALFFGMWITTTKLSNELSNTVLIRSGTVSVLTLYFLLTGLTSLFSPLLHLRVFLLIELLILAATGICILFIILSSSRVNQVDQKTVSDQKLMQICEKRIYDLLADSKNESVHAPLHSVYEKLKYGDKTGETGADESIVGVVLKLEQQLKDFDKTDLNLVSEVHRNLDLLVTLMDQRNAELAGGKRGGF